jgi:SnoaL-like domain
VELWELQAREAIRHTIAAYNFATDHGAFDDVAACFTEDGVLEVSGSESAAGRAAIVALLTTVVPDGDHSASGRATPRYVQHHVASTHFRSLTPERAEVHSYFLVTTDVGVDHWGRYRDRVVPVGEDRWLFEHRRAVGDGFAPDSRFRR